MSRNFPPTKFPHLRGAVFTCSNLDQRRFVTALFRYLRPIDSVLDTQAPLSQAVPRVMAKEVNKLCRKQKHGQQKAGPIPLVNAEEPKVASSSQQTDKHNCHSGVGIVAVFRYWLPKCLCRRGSLLRSLASQTQPTPGRIAFSKPDLTNPIADSF